MASSPFRSSTSCSSNVGPARLWFASLTLLAKAEKLFFTNWNKACRTLEEESIHDLRVASRRLREALRFFSPCLPSKRVSRLSKKVKDVTQMLGELRNADEAYLFFSALGAGEGAPCRPELDQLLEKLGHEREQAREGLGKRFRDADILQLRKQLRALRKNSNLFIHRKTDPFQEFSLFAGEALMKRAEHVAALLPKAALEADATAQHALRIAVKKMRYRLETMEPFLSVECMELREALKSYQDVLGKLHDVDVFAEMVVERVPDGPGREELLRLLALRRGELFAGLTQLLRRLPLVRLAQEARAKL